MPSRRFGLPLRFIAPGLCLAGGLLPLGCASSAPERPSLSRNIGEPSAAIVLASHAEPERTLPPPDLKAVPGEERQVPISFDTVLHLAEGSNAQVALAREKVNESYAEQELADKAWIPQINAGISYYRHEGGIQNEDGTLTNSSTGAFFPGLEIRTGVDLREATYARVDAERKMWQSRGELSRVTNETLLEAVSTYFDLLAARYGEGVALKLEGYHQKLLERAEKMLQPNDQTALVLVEGLRTEMSARKQARLRLRQQGDAAAAKLAYLLKMPPEVRLVPIDPQPVPIDLGVNAELPTAELVNRAITYGPGVQELQGLMSVIEEGMARLQGPAALLPAVHLCLSEGLFGAGLGADMAFDNRFDATLQFRWNITTFLTAREQRKIAESKLMQVQLSMDDLRGKLTFGVQEAQNAIVSGRDQVAHGQQMIDHAAKAYELSSNRYEKNLPGASAGEVQQAIRAVEQAQVGYLSAVTSYNKAEARLLLLLGRGASGLGCEPHR
jgi:outer membrane protein TolC